MALVARIGPLKQSSEMPDHSEAWIFCTEKWLRDSIDVAIKYDKGPISLYIGGGIRLLFCPCETAILDTKYHSSLTFCAGTSEGSHIAYFESNMAQSDREELDYSVRWEMHVALNTEERDAILNGEEHPTQKALRHLCAVIGPFSLDLLSERAFLHVCDNDAFLS